jgi:hypothetical protein
MMMVDQTSITNTIDSISDHRSDLSDANSVDSYVLIFIKFIYNIFFFCRAFSIENGVSTASEISENSSSTATLLNELQRVKEDLKSKDIEIQRAYEIRENTDREIEELTSSLFEVIFSKNKNKKFQLFSFVISLHIQWLNKLNMLKLMPNKNLKLQIKQ